MKFERLLRRYRILLPQQKLVVIFLLYMLVGLVLLSLPFAQKTSVGFIDNLFTSASAVSTTGLVTVPTGASYTFFGQLVILLLMQFSALGYMSFSSFLFLQGHSKLPRETKEIMKAEFSVPQDFNLNLFIKSIIFFTLFVEGFGTLFLFLTFYFNGGGFFSSLWSGLFHAVSAFCTAGFTLYPDSMSGFLKVPFVTELTSILALLGAFGFIPITEIAENMMGQPKKISYTSRSIFFSFLFLISFGGIMLLIFEPSLKNYDFSTRVYGAFAQAINAMTTAGYNNINLAASSAPALCALMLLMFIGGAPAGTSGGIKTTTAVTLFAVLVSRLKGRDFVRFNGKDIPQEKVFVASSALIFYMIVLYAVILLLTISENASFLEILFDSLAALSTAGLSLGLTEQMSAFGKLVLIFAMFVGRIGVITFGLAFFMRERQPREREEEPAKKVDIAV